MILQLNGVQVHKVNLDCSVTKQICDLPAVGNYPSWTPGNTGLGGPTTTVQAGFSAGKLAGLAGANPSGTTGNVWEMVIDDGARILPGKYLDPTFDYPPGQFQPVFSTNGEGIVYYHQAPTGPNDPNAQYTDIEPGPMTVNFITTNQLSGIVVHADPTEPKVRTSVSFQVVVPPGEAKEGETLTAVWNFQDGTSPPPQTLEPSQAGPNATTTHIFDTTGTYKDITVTISGDKGSGGSKTYPTVIVGNKAGPTGPGTHHPKKHKPPVSGSSHKKKTKPVSGNGSSPTGGTGTGGGGTTGPSSPAAQPSTITSQPTAPAPHPVLKKTLPKDPSFAGVPVSGILLSAPITEIARAASPSAAQGAGGTDKRTLEGAGGLPGAVGGIGLALLLLVGGFLSEGLPVARWR